MRVLAGIGLVVVGVAGCGDGAGDASDASSTAAATGSSGATTTSTSAATSADGSSSSGAPEPPPVTEGTVRLLTYNVAGLPEGISGSMPAEYIPQISPLLNLYELALVQEDFAYHEELTAQAEHPYQSEPHPDADPANAMFGDGLNEFSQFPFAPLDRVTWVECNGQLDSGSDCLTIKGFFRATHSLAEGVEVDVYDLHMDAGGSPEDQAARDAQVAQLVDFIAESSAERAVIVAGDTNMDEADESQLQALLDGAGLVDVCRALACGDEYRIDRVMVRDGGHVELTPTSWMIDAAFVDPEGNDLSDHEAVGVELAWRWVE